MSSLSQLLALFERFPGEELRLTTGESPYVLSEGERRSIGSAPMTTQVILAAAAEVVSQEDLADLPTQRPRVVRHEHGGETWVIEVSRVRAGVSLAVRRARTVVARMDQRRATAQHEVVASSLFELDIAVGAGPVRYPTPPNAAVPALGPPLVSRHRESATLPVAARPLAPPLAHGRKRIDPLLRTMIADGASDLHLSAGNPPVKLDCSGSYTWHFSHAYLAVNAVTAGETLYCQYFARDSGSGAPMSLSNAVAVTILP